MSNKFKKTTKASLAAVLVASSIVPVAASAAEATTLQWVVVEDANGNLVKYDAMEFAMDYAAGVLDKSQSPLYVIDSEGNVYDAIEYAIEMASNGNNEAAAFEAVTPEEGLTVVEGKIVDGKVVADGTPEENLNETFFYNLAA